MLVEDIRIIEWEYYSQRKECVVPDLLCAYFEQEKYELTYYFSEKYRHAYIQSEFYMMMSLMELNRELDAIKIYEKYKEDWYNLCKQGNIYWKHVALFSILFKSLNLSTYYENLFNDYHEDIFVQLIELLSEEPIISVINTECYSRAVERNPKIKSIWDISQDTLPQVVTFEDVQWRMWKKYNDQIGNGQKYGMEMVYDQDGIKIFSYKPKDVSASMHIITDGVTNIMLDCGCEITDTETVRIQVKDVLSMYKLDHIDAVFISHAHMDHYGSLNEIKRAKIFMTPTTRQLIRLMSPETSLASVSVLEEYSTVDVGGVTVTFIPNGHVCGSVAMDILWKDTKRIVYTGDFSVDDQKTVKGFNVDDVLWRDNRRVDVLITETTYGKKREMLSLKQYEKIFVELCDKQIEYGIKIIIPCFAVGRAQEIALLLKEMVRKKGKRILIDGLAARLTEFYQGYMNMDILDRNIAICNSELDYAEKLMNNDIILASSGMIKSGSASACYIERILEEEKTAVMKVGFIRKSEHMLMSVINRQNTNLNYSDIPLSAHVGYERLIETLNDLSPNCVIYVHGAGIEK